MRLSQVAMKFWRFGTAQVKIPVPAFLTACILMSTAISKQNKIRFLLGRHTLMMLSCNSLEITFMISGADFISAQFYAVLHRSMECLFRYTR